jgi:prephenate dehydrogenase (NADP+)
MYRLDASPTSPEDEQPAIGLIGMGAMGRMYADCFSKAGWKRHVIRMGEWQQVNGIC